MSPVDQTVPRAAQADLSAVEGETAQELLQQLVEVRLEIRREVLRSRVLASILAADPKVGGAVQKELLSGDSR